MIEPDLIQLLGIIIAFGSVILLVMRRFNYGLAIILGSLVLGAFSGFSLNDFVQVLLSTVTDPVTHELVLVIALIPVLATCMTETGMIEGFINSLKGFLSSRAILAVVPALFGLLPMIGGALISAPLINSEAEKMKLEANMKAYINVWFRHCMFLINPISTGLILASRLGGVSIFDLIFMQMSTFVIYIVFGYFLSIFSIKSFEKSSMGGSEKSGFNVVVSLFIGVSPILFIVLLMALGVPLALALIAGIVLVLGLKRFSYKKVPSLIWRGFNWRLIFAIFGVMLFHHMIEASGAVNLITSYIGAGEAYPLLFLILLSLFAGVATAMPEIALGVSLPVATQMLGNLSPVVVSMLYLAVIFAYIVSPLHLCLILTVEYYKAQLQRVYRLLIPSALLVCLIGLMIAYGLMLYF